MPPLTRKSVRSFPTAPWRTSIRGRRRLPINDAAHVRNALARFSQVVFEDEGARDRARSRLLTAAMKHEIMPRRLRQRAAAAAAQAAKGHMTFPLLQLALAADVLAERTVAAEARWRGHRPGGLSWHCDVERIVV
jgi:hypothetical protein